MEINCCCMLDDPGRIRSQITSVVCQIQRFDFDYNLVDLHCSDAKSNNTSSTDTCTSTLYLGTRVPVFLLFSKY